MRKDVAVDVLDGLFSPKFMHIPMVVPAGYEGGPGKSLDMCKVGEYSADRQLDCDTCPIGKVCSFTSNEPTECNEGFESLSAGL